jgi:hypothetical protein
MQVVGALAGIFAGQTDGPFFEHRGEMVESYTIYERSVNDSKVMKK